MHDHVAWREGMGYSDDVVMQITEGTLHYGGWEITARRGPKDGVYVVAHSARYVRNDDKDAPFHESYHNKVLLVGCGVYGWENDEAKYADYIAALAAEHNLDLAEYEIISGSGGESDAEWRDFLIFWHLGKEESLTNPASGEPEFYPPEQRETRFLGVEAPDVEFLANLVAEIAGEEMTDRRTNEALVSWPETWLRRLDFTKGLRFNQGDVGYFNGGGTPVGEAAEPIFTQILKGQGDG